MRLVTILILLLIGMAPDVTAWGSDEMDQRPFAERWREVLDRFKAGQVEASVVDDVLEEAVRVDDAQAKYEIAVALRAAVEDSPDDRERILRHLRDGANALSKWKHGQWASRKLSRLARERGDVSEARRVLRESVEITPPDVLSHEVAIDLAELCAFQGDFDEARNWLERAERRLTGPTDGPERLRSLARIQGQRAQCLLDQGIVDRAALWLRRHDETLKALVEKGASSPHDAVEAAIYRANILLATGRFDDVVRELDEILGVGHAADSVPGAAGALRVRLGVALYRLERRDVSRPKRARDVLASASEDPTAQPNDRRAAMVRLAQVALFEGDYDACRRYLADVEAQTGDEPGSPIENAIFVSVRSRLASASAAPPEDQANSLLELQRSFDAVVAEWQTRSTRHGGAGLLHFDHVGLLVAELIRRAVVNDDADGIERALGHLVRAQEQGSLLAQLGMTRYSIDRVRDELLTPGEGMLLWFPAVEESYVFALDGDTLLVETLPSREVIDQARERFVERVFGAINAPSGRSEELAMALQPVAAALTELLIPPRVRRVAEKWSALTVVAPDLLGYLPVECLTFAGEGPLGVERSVSYLPSLPVGLRLCERARESQSGRDWGLFVTNPTHSAEVVERFPDLQPLRIDTTRLASFYPSATRELSGDRATWSAVREATSTVAGFLQIFAHGVQDYERERSAGLILAPDASSSGLVWGDSMDGLRVPPLVILSACGTGRGPARRGDPDITSLAAVFLLQGASAVVLPYADVYDQETLDLMVQFHRALTGGAPPALALQQARRAVCPGNRVSSGYLRTLVHVRGLGHRLPRKAVASPGPQSGTDQGTSNPTVTPPRFIAGAAVVALLVIACWITSNARSRRRSQASRK